jgi:hypothetical protein
MIVGLWGIESKSIPRLGETVESIVEKANTSCSKKNSKNNTINRRIENPVLPEIK